VGRALVPDTRHDLYSQMVTLHLLRDPPEDRNASTTSIASRSRCSSAATGGSSASFDGDNDESDLEHLREALDACCLFARKLDAEQRQRHEEEHERQGSGHEQPRMSRAPQRIPADASPEDKQAGDCGQSDHEHWR
jgi:hypothetical protein